MRINIEKARAFCMFVGVLSIAMTGFAVDIATPEAFVENMLVNSSGSFRLTANIDLGGVAFHSVPLFNGTLDGDGHTLSGLGDQPFCDVLSGTIKNLTLDCGGITRSGTGIGALGNECIGGKVIDVTVRNVTIKHKTYNLSLGNGAFFGTVYDGSSFIRCVADSTCTIGYNISPDSRNNSVGGIAGMIKFKYDVVDDISFVDCVNKATIASVGNANPNCGAGGIVGLISGGRGSITHIIFRNCENRGVFTASGNFGHFGGIVGYAVGVSDKARSFLMHFDGCRNYSDITFTLEFSGVGGIVGYCSGAATFTMDGCANYGKIGGDSVSYAGGLCGYVGQYISAVAGMDSTIFRNCANYGDVTGTTTVGGIAGSADTNIGWNTGKFYFQNCAVYGAVSSSAGMVGQIVGLVSTAKSCDLDNCYSPVGTLWNKGTDPKAKDATVTNCKTPSDVSALNELNAVASGADLYVPWVAGGTDPELSFFAVGSRSSYPVVFRDVYGSMLKCEEVVSGGSASAPDAPGRVGYVFDSWDKSFDNITAPLVVYPVYTAEKHVLTFDSRGGTFIAAITNFTGEAINYGDTPVKDGFEFKGWSLDGALVKTMPAVMPSADQTYYAVWYPIGGGGSIHLKMNLLLWDLHSPSPLTATSAHIVGLHDLIATKNIDVCSFLSAQNGYTSVYYPEGWSGGSSPFNGSSDGSARRIATLDSALPMLSPSMQGASHTPVSNSSTGYMVFENADGAQILLLNCHFGSDKTIAAYITAQANQIASLRTQYPSAFFVLTGEFKKFAAASDYATTYSSSPSNVADALATATGFHKVQAGDDFYWIMTELVPTRESVEKISDSSISSDPGYVASIEFGTSAQYTVRFLDWNDAELSVQQVFEGEDATPPANPYRAGYTFLGWEGVWTAVTQNQDVKATYKAGETTYYRVRFYDYDETLLSEAQVASGTAATPPANPIRDGYDFVGWDKPYDYITSAVDIHAQYAKQMIPTVYVSTGGTDSPGRGQIDHPFKTITYAINSLGSTGGEVRVFAGAYDGTTPIVIDTPVVVTSYGEGEVVVRNTRGAGNSPQNCRAFELNNVKSALIGITIAKGEICIYDSNNSGAGVLITAGMVSNCVVRGCNAWQGSTSLPYGGGVSVYGSGALLTHSVVSNCITFFSANWGSVCGGGVYVDNGGVVQNTIVSDCHIRNTTAGYERIVGGIFVKNGTARNCTVLDCYGSYTGGLYAGTAGVIVNCAVINCRKVLTGVDEVSPWSGTATSFYNCAGDAAVLEGMNSCFGTLTANDFVDLAGGDYTPAKSGTLTNKGKAIPAFANTYDFVGNKRVVKVIDIGALESQFVPGFIITGKRID